MSALADCPIPPRSPATIVPSPSANTPPDRDPRSWRRQSASLVFCAAVIQAMVDNVAAAPPTRSGKNKAGTEQLGGDKQGIYVRLQLRRYHQVRQIQRCRCHQRHAARSACSACTTMASDQSGSAAAMWASRWSRLCRCRLDRCNAVFEHDVMHRVLEPQAGEPSPVHPASRPVGCSG